MHSALLAWRRERRRSVQRNFASLGAFSRSPLLGPGGKPPGNSDTGGKGKDKKKEDSEKESKGNTDTEAEKKPGQGSLGQLLKETDVTAEKTDKPPAARIVAYSDSEGEDEPFRLTRRRKKKKEEGEQTEAEEDADQAPSTSAGPRRDIVPTQIARTERRIFKSVRSCSRRGLTKLRDEAGWGLLLQAMLLWLFRRWRRRSAKRFELLTLAIALPDTICFTVGANCPSQGLPGRLQALMQFAESWARPSALLMLGDFVQEALPKKKRRKMLTTISQSVRVFQEAELEARSPSTRPPPPPSGPRLAADGAAKYKIELAEMKRILDLQGAKLPAERFDDTQAELYRFAASAGLLQAASHEEKALAIQEGAQRVLKTVEWLRKYKFMPPAQLKELHHLVRWQGTDTEGLPILVINISRACAECQGDAADAVADAIISQAQRAMVDVFSNRHGPDKMVVVVDARGTVSIQAARNVALFKHVAVTLNKHCPCRLQQLFVVDLPPQLRWVLATLKPLLHSDTKGKLRTISISDPALPLPAQALQDSRPEPDLASEGSGTEQAEGSRLRRVSIPELPVMSSPSAVQEDESSRRGSIPALPSAESHRSKRRVRILDLPYIGQQPKPSRLSSEARESREAQESREAHSPGSFLRPALKRSMSAGLLGIKDPAQQTRGDDEAASEESPSSLRNGEVD